MTPTALSPLGFSLSVAGMVHILFFAVVLFYLVYTAVLYYHWQTYSSDVRMNFLTMVVYFATTLPLIVTLTTLATIM